MRNRIHLLVLTAALLATRGATAQPAFGLHDGDRVVFFGFGLDLVRHVFHVIGTGEGVHRLGVARLVRDVLLGPVFLIQFNMLLLTK